MKLASTLTLSSELPPTDERILDPDRLTDEERRSLQEQIRHLQAHASGETRRVTLEVEEERPLLHFRRKPPRRFRSWQKKLSLSLKLNRHKSMGEHGNLSDIAQRKQEASEQAQEQMEEVSSEPTKRLNANVPESLHKAVRMEAARRGVEMKTIMVEALREYLPSYSHE